MFAVRRYFAVKRAVFAPRIAATVIIRMQMPVPNPNVRPADSTLESRLFAIRVAARRMAALLGRQDVRFVITGGGVAGLFYLLTYGLIRAGMPAFWGTALAYAVGFAISYLTQQAWTFRRERGHAEAFPRYLAAQIVCGTVSASIARLLVSSGTTPAVTALGSTLIASALSYVLSRFWVFRT